MRDQLNYGPDSLFADLVLNWGTRRMIDMFGPVKIHASQHLLPLCLSSRNARIG